MTEYHVIICNDYDYNYRTEIVTYKERELRNILVYFILDKYDDYENNKPPLDERILHVYDDLPIKEVIERAKSVSDKNKTYIGAIIEGGSMISYCLQ